jgi:AcrR family transcriptional regulator
MARPRRDAQEVLLERIATALGRRRSMAPWTLAEISPDAGLSPAGLVKRFGSRQGILLALSGRWIEAIPVAAGGGSSAGAELRRWIARRFAAHGPEQVAQGLVNLLDDLADDQLRALLGKGWAKEIRYLSSLLASMDLPRLGDPDRAAALLFDALNGAMLRCATESEALLVRDTLDGLMEVWK